MVCIDTKVRVLDIVRGTTVDGPGFRTSVYLSGCEHHCQGCHNPQSWDFGNGESVSLGEILDIIEEEDFDVTFSGGDPLYHPLEVSFLCDQIHVMGHNVWLYTGFTWEEITSNPEFMEVVMRVDVVVDGPFVETRKERDLLFRGSSNQRIIDVAQSIKAGKPVQWRR